MIDPNQHDQFVVKRKLNLVVNRYDVQLPGAEPVAHVRQKPFALKEELHLTPDEGSTHAVMTMRARRRFDPSATYDVFDDVGTSAGIVKQRFGASLLRSTWELGVFRRRRGSLRDTYDLDLTGDPDRTLDPRLVLAVSVGLDAPQAR